MFISFLHIFYHFQIILSSDIAIQCLHREVKYSLHTARCKRCLLQKIKRVES